MAEHKMTVIEHIRYIKERQYKQDPMNAVHWLLVYRRADGIILAYDDKHPEQAHANITAKHPDYTYLTTKGVNAAHAAADYARATRAAAKLFEWLRETSDIHTP